MVKSAVERRAREADADATSARRLTELADDPSAFVRAAVAGNLATPIEVLARLADDSRWEVRWTVPLRAATETEVADIVLASPRGDVRRQLAALAPGIRDSDRRYHAILAATAGGGPGAWKLELEARRDLRPRPPLSPDVQGRLARDRDRQVRERLAQLTGEREIFDLLMLDTHPSVRASCAGNEAVADGEDLDRLLADRHRAVRYAAVMTDRLAHEQMLRVAHHDRSTAVLDALVHCFNTTDEVLQWVASHRLDDADASAHARWELDKRATKRQAGALERTPPTCWICGTQMTASRPDTTPHWRCPVCGRAAAEGEVVPPRTDSG